MTLREPRQKTAMWDVKSNANKMEITPNCKSPWCTEAPFNELLKFPTAVLDMSVTHQLTPTKMKNQWDIGLHFEMLYNFSALSSTIAF